MRALTRLVLGGAAAGAAGLAYAHWEAKQFALRFRTVPVLAPGADPIRILHLSDMHFVPGHTAKHAWVQSLAALEPDLVVVTGDFIAHEDAIPHVLDTLEPLFASPGVFVFGSNDYFAPTPLNPAKYLAGPSQLEPTRVMLPWTDLVDGLQDNGWADLRNTSARIPMHGGFIDARGVDDPHISRDDYAAIAGPFAEDAVLRLGLTHAPYLRILDAMVADGADLVMAGHTHGGQLCLPGYGTLVTNCDLDPRRGKGLSSHSAHGHTAALHVSAGLGTSPYAPFRFACRPEAAVLTVVPRAETTDPLR